MLKGVKRKITQNILNSSFSKYFIF